MDNGIAQDCADIIEAGSQATMERNSSSNAHVTDSTAPVSDVPAPALAIDPTPSDLRANQLVPGTEFSHAVQMMEDFHFPQEQHPVATEDSVDPYHGFYPIGTVKNDPTPSRKVWARIGHDFAFEFQPGDTDYTGHAIPLTEIHKEVWQTGQVKRAKELNNVTDCVVLAEEYQTTAFDELQIRLYDTMMRNGDTEEWPWRNGSDFIENKWLAKLVDQYHTLSSLEEDIPDDMTLLDVINAHGKLVRQLNESCSNFKDAMEVFVSRLRNAQDPLDVDQASEEIQKRMATEISAPLEALVAYPKTRGSTNFTSPFAWEKRMEKIAGVRLASDGLSGQASPSQAHDPILKGFSATATIKEIRERFGGQTGEDEIGEEGDREGIKVKENNSDTMELD